MNTVFIALGYFGAFVSLYAYFKVSHRGWSAKSAKFQMSNAIAGACLVVYGIHSHAYPNAGLNIVWFGIAATSLYRIFGRGGKG